MITLRPFDPNRDIPRIVQLLNTVDPEPITIEEFASIYTRNAPGYVVHRVVAVDPQQRVLGYALSIHEPWMAEGHFYVWIVVDPPHRKHGIGSSLYTHIESFLQGHAVHSLESDVGDTCREDLAFAEQRGFSIARHLFDSTLDLAHFDQTAFAGCIESVVTQGIRFRTFADLADSSASQDKLYDLYHTITLDMPGRDSYFLSREDFRQRVFDPRWCEPEGRIVAFNGEEWIGLAIVRLFTESNAASNFMTAVDRRYRGRKIALALKLLAIQYAQRRGATYIRTNNDSENTPMLALNRKLGYQPQPGKYLLRKNMP